MSTSGTFKLYTYNKNTRLNNLIDGQIKGYSGGITTVNQTKIGSMFYGYGISDNTSTLQEFCENKLKGIVELTEDCKWNTVHLKPGTPKFNLLTSEINPYNINVKYPSGINLEWSYTTNNKWELKSTKIDIKSQFLIIVSVPKIKNYETNLNNIYYLCQDMQNLYFVIIHAKEYKDEIENYLKCLILYTTKIQPVHIDIDSDDETLKEWLMLYDNNISDNVLVQHIINYLTEILIPVSSITTEYYSILKSDKNNNTGYLNQSIKGLNVTIRFLEIKLRDLLYNYYSDLDETQRLIKIQNICTLADKYGISYGNKHFSYNNGIIRTFPIVYSEYVHNTDSSVTHIDIPDTTVDNIYLCADMFYDTKECEFDSKMIKYKNYQAVDSYKKHLSKITGISKGEIKDLLNIQISLKSDKTVDVSDSIYILDSSKNVNVNNEIILKSNIDTVCVFASTVKPKFIDTCTNLLIYSDDLYQNIEKVTVKHELKLNKHSNFYIESSNIPDMYEQISESVPSHANYIRCSGLYIYIPLFMSNIYNPLSISKPSIVSNIDSQLYTIVKKYILNFISNYNKSTALSVTNYVIDLDNEMSTELEFNDSDECINLQNYENMIQLKVLYTKELNLNSDYEKKIEKNLTTPTNRTLETNIKTINKNINDINSNLLYDYKDLELGSVSDQHKKDILDIVKNNISTKVDIPDSCKKIIIDNFTNLSNLKNEIKKKDYDNIKNTLNGINWVINDVNNTTQDIDISSIFYKITTDVYTTILIVFLDEIIKERHTKGLSYVKLDDFKKELLNNNVIFSIIGRRLLKFYNKVLYQRKMQNIQDVDISKLSIENIRSIINYILVQNGHSYLRTVSNTIDDLKSQLDHSIDIHNDILELIKESYFQYTIIFGYIPTGGPKFDHKVFINKLKEEYDLTDKLISIILNSTPELSFMIDEVEKIVQMINVPDVVVNSDLKELENTMYANKMNITEYVIRNIDLLGYYLYTAKRNTLLNYIYSNDKYDEVENQGSIHMLIKEIFINRSYMIVNNPIVKQYVTQNLFEMLKINYKKISSELIYYLKDNLGASGLDYEFIIYNILTNEDNRSLNGIIYSKNVPDVTQRKKVYPKYTADIQSYIIELIKRLNFDNISSVAFGIKEVSNTSLSQTNLKSNDSIQDSDYNLISFKNIFNNIIFSYTFNNKNYLEHKGDISKNNKYFYELFPKSSVIKSYDDISKYIVDEVLCKKSQEQQELRLGFFLKCLCNTMLNTGVTIKAVYSSVLPAASPSISSSAPKGKTGKSGKTSLIQVVSKTNKNPKISKHKSGKKPKGKKSTSSATLFMENYSEIKGDAIQKTDCKVEELDTRFYLTRKCVSNTYNKIFEKISKSNTFREDIITEIFIKITDSKFNIDTYKYKKELSLFIMYICYLKKSEKFTMLTGLNLGITKEYKINVNSKDINLTNLFYPTYITKVYSIFIDSWYGVNVYSPKLYPELFFGIKGSVNNDIITKFSNSSNDLKSVTILRNTVTHETLQTTLDIERRIGLLGVSNLSGVQTNNNFNDILLTDLFNYNTLDLSRDDPRIVDTESANYDRKDIKYIYKIYPDKDQAQYDENTMVNTMLTLNEIKNNIGVFISNDNPINEIVFNLINLLYTLSKNKLTDNTKYINAFANEIIIDGESYENVLLDNWLKDLSKQNTSVKFPVNYDYNNMRYIYKIIKHFQKLTTVNVYTNLNKWLKDFINNLLFSRFTPTKDLDNCNYTVTYTLNSGKNFPINYYDLITFDKKKYSNVSYKILYIFEWLHSVIPAAWIKEVTDHNNNQLQKLKDICIKITTELAKLPVTKTSKDFIHADCKIHHKFTDNTLKALSVNKGDSSPIRIEATTLPIVKGSTCNCTRKSLIVDNQTIQQYNPKPKAKNSVYSKLLHDNSSDPDLKILYDIYMDLANYYKACTTFCNTKKPSGGSGGKRSKGSSSSTAPSTGI